MSELAKSPDHDSDSNSALTSESRCDQAPSVALAKWARLFSVLALSLSGCSSSAPSNNNPLATPPALVENAPAQIQFFNAALTPDQNNQLVASLYFLNSQPRTNWPQKFLFELQAYDRDGTVIDSLSVDVPVDQEGAYKQTLNTGIVLPYNAHSFDGVLIAFGKGAGESVTKTIPRLSTAAPQGN